LGDNLGSCIPNREPRLTPSFHLINRCYMETVFMSRPPATTFEYLQFHAANTPDRVALIMDDGEYTYGRFADDALRFTKALADLGIQRRQIVTIHIPHFYIEWLLTIACENLGAVSVSDDARNWKRANYLYQHVDVGLTNTPADEEPPFQYHCLADDWVRATLGMDLAIAQEQQVIVPELDDMVRIARSSGSTGVPKLIPKTLSNENYYSYRWANSLGLNYFSLILITSPLFIPATLTQSNSSIFIGATIAVSSEPSKFIFKYKVTHVTGLLIHIQNFIDGLVSGSKIRNNLIVQVYGANISGDFKKTIALKLTQDTMNMYGSNEVNSILNMTDHEIGIIIPGTELEIRNEQHVPVPDGSVGLIAVRNQGMVDGYYKNEEETRKRFHNGWFYTGDAGIKIGPRKVKLLGRADDMVIMGGVKQSPLVLEDTLRNGTGVKDAAVVGIKASDGGDLVCVALVLTDDANEEAIRAGIHQLWAVLKVRVIIAVVDDLARTENGKVSRAKVRDFFREQLEAEVAAS
jgi:acyl-CoA synthetase (AMP-forming)/AMP-acid ligase II